MSTETGIRQAHPLQDIDYPHSDSDGEPVPDNGINAERMRRSRISLRRALHCRGLTAYVEEDIFVYPVEGSPTIRAAPDLFAAPGCAPFPPRRVFLCWNEPGPVAFAGEFLSITAGEHLGSPKIRERVDRYRDSVGTAELFLYEELGEDFDSGFRFLFLRLDAATGEYGEVAPDPSGFFHVDSLGLDLRPVCDGIEFRDPGTGRIFTPCDALDTHLHAEAAQDHAEAERKHAEAERKHAQAAQEHAEAERKRAESERKRAESERKHAQAERKHAQAAQERARAAQEREEAANERAESERERAEAAERRLREVEQRLRELEGR